MQLWIARDGTVAVDDAVYGGINVSSIAPNVALVFWHGDVNRGEVLYNDRCPVREPFTDLTPYLPIFNDWFLAAAGLLPGSTRSIPADPPLSLTQAQAVKGALVDSLFAGKRQAPITTGGQTFDGSDAEQSAMANAISAAAEQNIDSVNAVGGATNTAFSTMATRVNTALSSSASDVTSKTNTAFGSMSSSANTAFANSTVNVKSGLDSLASSAQGDDAFVVASINAAHTAFNNAYGTDVANNAAGVNANIVTPVAAAAAFPIGVGGISFAATGMGIAANSSVSAPALTTYSTSAPTVSITAQTVAPPTVSPSTITGPTITWSPLNGSQQAMAFADFAALLKSLTDRRATLKAQQITHRTAIAALTTPAAVAKYDITSGW